MSTSNENIDFSNIDDEITVEEFLTKQCQEQIDRLKMHSEDLVKQFQAESAEVREKLVKKLNTEAI